MTSPLALLPDPAELERLGLTMETEGQWSLCCVSLHGPARDDDVKCVDYPEVDFYYRLARDDR